MLYVIADHHFGHFNAIKHCNRPFESADEMDEYMVKAWNSVITPQDEVYHLGDFEYRSKKPIEYYVSKLKGKIYLIFGNHDKKARKKAHLFAGCWDYKEINYQSKHFVLCHYPFLTWNRKCRGSIHLHGHSHGKLPPTAEAKFDVGVDKIGYYPISLDYIIKVAKYKEKLYKCLKS